VKLVIEGGGGVLVVDDPPPQPVKAARPRLRIVATGATTRRCFMGFPRSGKNNGADERILSGSAACSRSVTAKNFNTFQPAQKAVLAMLTRSVLFLRLLY
jgi:hypothetical protein